MRRIPVIALGLAFVLLASGSVEAQRRRAVRATPPNTPPPVNGQCHTFNFVRAGLVASYVSNPPTNFTVTYIKDTATQTVTKQKVTTPQATADADTVIDTETVGVLRGIRNVNVKSTTPVPVIGSLTIETDISFVPSLVAGPADGWCVGNKWNIPAVTQTVQVKSPIAPPVSKINQLAASEGEVLAVGETVVVPAGSFRTVKYRGLYSAGETVSPSIVWMSMDHNIVVRQETYDAAGALTSTVELTSVQ